MVDRRNRFIDDIPSLPGSEEEERRRQEAAARPKPTALDRVGRVARDLLPREGAGPTIGNSLAAIPGARAALHGGGRLLTAAGTLLRGPGTKLPAGAIGQYRNAATGRIEASRLGAAGQDVVRQGVSSATRQAAGTAVGAGSVGAGVAAAARGDEPAGETGTDGGIPEVPGGRVLPPSGDFIASTGGPQAQTAGPFAEGYYGRFGTQAQTAGPFAEGGEQRTNLAERIGVQPQQETRSGSVGRSLTRREIEEQRRRANFDFKSQLASARSLRGSFARAAAISKVFEKGPDGFFQDRVNGILAGQTPNATDQQNTENRQADQQLTQGNRQLAINAFEAETDRLNTLTGQAGRRGRGSSGSEIFSSEDFINRSIATARSLNIGVDFDNEADVRQYSGQLGAFVERGLASFREQFGNDVSDEVLKAKSQALGDLFNVGLAIQRASGQSAEQGRGFIDRANSVAIGPRGARGKDALFGNSQVNRAIVDTDNPGQTVANLRQIVRGLDELREVQSGEREYQSAALGIRRETQNVSDSRIPQFLGGRDFITINDADGNAIQQIDASFFTENPRVENALRRALNELEQGPRG